MSAARSALRERCLRALGVQPLRLQSRMAAAAMVGPVVAETSAIAPPARIQRLALQPDPAELRDPGIRKMYAALTEAVAKAGLQSVRTCDVPADPSAAVMVFGGAAPPANVPATRVLHADPLALLHADRGRKRRLWEQLQALGRSGVR